MAGLATVAVNGKDSANGAGGNEYEKGKSKCELQLPLTMGFANDRRSGLWAMGVTGLKTKVRRPRA